MPTQQEINDANAAELVKLRKEMNMLRGIATEAAAATIPDLDNSLTKTVDGKNYRFKADKGPRLMVEGEPMHKNKAILKEEIIRDLVEKESSLIEEGEEEG